VKDNADIPQMWTIVGETIQWKPLATNQLVKVVASDAANNSIATVRITYTEADGYTGETVSEKLTGAFSTGVSTTKAVLAGWNIHRIRASENWKGEIKVQQTSDDADIANLRAPYQPEAGNTVQRLDTRLLIRVWPVPNADYQGTVIWRHIPRKLVNASDILEIPAFSAIAYMAAADLLKVDQEFLKAREYERDATGAMTDAIAGETQKGSVSRPRMGNVMRATGFRPWGRYWSKY
jgi:hypothetical protein